MSDERIIHLAELTFIENSLRRLVSDLGSVSDQVSGVGQEVEATRAELAELQEAFNRFVAADLMAKELALAETRQVKVRQELETRFGYYAQVRRHATGILQAADLSVVRQETVTTATESLMLSAPGYWLAPALVALSCWLADNRPLAEKALAEALRRDDEKTSLFFTLISRRAGRAPACYTWLDRYLGLQNPLRIDRQAVVLVDALASGVFGSGIRARCSKRIEDWIAELSERAGFLEEQRAQWKDALRSKTPSLPSAARYRYLHEHSPTWPDLEQTLNGAALQDVVLRHFTAIFDGQIVPSPNLLNAVDQLLNNLVQNFDDEELPLRRQDRLNQLIIEESGDKKAAGARFDLESKSLDEEVSFTQLLTNAAMHPENSHASRATQRLAVALSRGWIKDAHQDLTATNRSAVPSQVKLRIEDWEGSTADGSDEKELAASLTQHLQRRKKKALDEMVLGTKHWVGLVFGVLMVLYAFVGGFVPFLVGGAAIAWFLVSRAKIQQARAKLLRDYADLQKASLEILAAMLAEVVEWHRDFAQRDARAAEVTRLLENLSPEQYALNAPGSAREVVASAAR